MQLETRTWGGGEGQSNLSGALREVSLLSSCAACRGGGSMLRVRIVTWSTWALLVGSSCMHTACNELHLMHHNPRLLCHSGKASIAIRCYETQEALL